MRLGARLDVGDVICLHGELGAGKTTLVRGLAHGWGASDEVSSPTFVIENIYRRADGGELVHLDMYRIGSLAEAEELDFDEMMLQGPLLIEWAERVVELMPPERMWVDLEHVAEEQRQMRFRATGARYDALLEQLRQAVVGA